MLAISIEQKDGKAYIRSPYNADFVRRIRLMGGKWDADSRRWVVCSDAVDAVRKIMMEIYGESDESPAFETVTLKPSTSPLTSPSPFSTVTDEVMKISGSCASTLFKKS